MAEAIRDVMTASPVCLALDASLQEAAQAMREQDIGDVFVVDGSRLAGIVTDRDIVVRGIADGKDPRSVQIREVFSDQPLAVAPDDPVDKAIDLMRQHALRRLPVVDDGKPVGAVSLGDLAVDRDPQSTLADISAAAPNS